MIEEEDYDFTFAVNVKAVFFFAKEAIDLLRKSKKGANILVTSSLSAVTPSKILGVYAMTKASMVNMVKWLAVELMDDGIRVNAIAPGFTMTNMVTTEIGMGVHKLLPPKALGQPEEVASIAAMICSSDGSFLNGEKFVLSGGYPNPKFNYRPKL